MRNKRAPPPRLVLSRYLCVLGVREIGVRSRSDLSLPRVALAAARSSVRSSTVKVIDQQCANRRLEPNILLLNALLLSITGLRTGVLKMAAEECTARGPQR